jgi:hypothetical protein
LGKVSFEGEPPTDLQFLLRAFRSRYSFGSIVATASLNGGVGQATDFSGGAAIAGKALARTTAAITAAIATSKMMRFTGATSSGRAEPVGPASS